MGVQARITLYASSEPDAERAAARAFAVIAEIESQTSDYRVDNAVAHLAARSGTGDWTPIGPHLARMIQTSTLLARESAGAFDPTMGPLTHLWRRQRQTPNALISDSDLAAARQLVNWRHIESSDHQARLLHKGMKLDFGGIAKGYAAESAVRELTLQGSPRCLVSIAGDVFAGDAPPKSDGWAVQIESGQHTEAATHADGSILLVQSGSSTSGDVEQVITSGSTRQSHIIDIRTGRGSDRRRSVTVIACTGWESDALATIFYLLDDDECQRIIDQHPGTRAIIFDRVEHAGQVQVRKREITSTAVRMSAIR